jgi:hypothetical protein
MNAAVLGSGDCLLPLLSTEKAALLLILLVTMEAVVLYIWGSETNNLALENIEFPESSRQQVSVRVTATTTLLPNVDLCCR